jgi:hypothetical protein
LKANTLTSGSIKLGGQITNSGLKRDNKLVQLNLSGIEDADIVVGVGQGTFQLDDLRVGGVQHAGLVGKGGVKSGILIGYDNDLIVKIIVVDLQ